MGNHLFFSALFIVGAIFVLKGYGVEPHAEAAVGIALIGSALGILAGEWTTK